MYNDIFPKEALELYLILKLDTNNSYMQDVFFLIFRGYLYYRTGY